MTKMSNEKIESLLANKDSISNSSIKNALTKMAKQKEEEQEKKVLESLSFVESILDNAVHLLRKARKEEKAKKAYLVEIATAREQFHKNADLKAFNIANTTANRNLSKALYS